MLDSLSGAQRAPAPPLLPRWLLVAACGWLCVVAPLAFALEAQAALPRLTEYGAPAWALLASRAAIAVLGLTAGLLLWRGEPAGLRLAVAWGVLAAVATLIVAATPYFPANRAPSTKRMAVEATTTLYVASAILFALAARRRR